jgi:hypothetical protein
MGVEVLLERRFAIHGFKYGEEFGDEIDQHEAEYRQFTRRRKVSRSVIQSLDGLTVFRRM